MYDALTSRTSYSEAEVNQAGGPWSVMRPGRGAEPYSTDRSTVLLLRRHGKTLRGLRRAAVHFSKIFGGLRYTTEG